MAAAEADLRRTEITQPAVLSVDLALTRLLAAYGIVPDMVMGHSLGEYGALVASGALSFAAALEAVSARGQEMAHLSVEDNGAMAAVFAPLGEIQQIVDAGRRLRRDRQRELARRRRSSAGPQPRCMPPSRSAPSAASRLPCSR